MFFVNTNSSSTYCIVLLGDFTDFYTYVQTRVLDMMT